jgi:hypothetical protein
MSRKARPIILIVAVVVLLVSIGSVAALLLRDRGTGSTKSTFPSTAPTAGQQTGYVWRITSGAPPTELAHMDRAVAEVMAAHPIRLRKGEQISFEGLRVSGDWALTEPIFRAVSGAILNGEGFPILLHKVNGNWRAAYPGTPEFNSWLEDVPTELIPSDTKQLLR